MNVSSSISGTNMKCEYQYDNTGIFVNGRRNNNDEGRTSLENVNYHIDMNKWIQRTTTIK